MNRLLQLLDRIIERNPLIAHAPRTHATGSVMIGGLPSNHPRCID